MPGLSKDEQQALDRMKKAARELAGKPDPSTPAPRADRFREPVGLDDAGKPFDDALPSALKRAPKKR